MPFTMPRAMAETEYLQSTKLTSCRKLMAFFLRFDEWKHIKLNIIWLYIIWLFPRWVWFVFLQCCREVAEKYPEIKYEEVVIDNCCMMVWTIISLCQLTIVVLISVLSYYSVFPFLQIATYNLPKQVATYYKQIGVIEKVIQYLCFRNKWIEMFIF